jgi:catechol 2,3-dioxygenase-like lactoylglutathione lyase family enzyme
MELGNFSVSLSVADLHKSMEFYGKLGFVQRGGNLEENWVVLRNGDTIIGLFQGMFEGNMMTFNPGWDRDAQELPEFTDVRAIQTELEANGVELTQRAESGSGPGYLSLVDPDGNVILIDQHV